jgi:hypothetical protein
MKPTVGRIIHYFCEDSDKNELFALPAIVIKIVDEDDQRLKLYIIGNNYPYYADYVQYSKEPKVGCWSWPKRDE